MRRSIKLFAVGALSILIVSAGYAQNHSRVIVPGHSVGQVVVGKPVPGSLGKPASGDGAMGRYETTYVSKTSPYRLDILQRRVFEENDTERVLVKTIRVESPYFRTENGVTPRSSLSAIRQQYPASVAREQWKHIADGKAHRYTIYDDRQQGIAFEIENRTKKATAIYVHAAGQPLEVNGHYTEDWQRIEGKAR